jgi:hypothetical protein
MTERYYTERHKKPCSVSLCQCRGAGYTVENACQGTNALAYFGGATTAKKKRFSNVDTRHDQRVSILQGPIL